MSRVVLSVDGEADFTSLVDVGPLIEVEITVPVPRKRYLADHGHLPHPSIRGYALLDTGATISAVDDRVMADLEIPPIENEETQTPHGMAMSNVYNASVTFPQLGWSDVPLEECLGCFLGDDQHAEPKIVMLLGRDLLQYLKLEYDGPNGIATVELKGGH